MTQEEKELLIKDLCARLPYGVKVQVCNVTEYTPILKGILGDDLFLQFDYITKPIKNGDSTYNLIEDNIKPHLRPMSSMTEEEKEVLERLSNCFVQTRVLERCRNGKIKKQISYLDNEVKEIDLFGDNDKQYNHISQQNFIDTSDFFNSRHIDYRGLIEKGLALEASKDMYKI